MSDAILVSTAREIADLLVWEFVEADHPRLQVCHSIRAGGGLTLGTQQPDLAVGQRAVILRIFCRKAEVSPHCLTFTLTHLGEREIMAALRRLRASRGLKS